jgi:hypothetical protein
MRNPGNLMQAIRQLRLETNCGLKEAVEAMKGKVASI